MLFSRKDSGEFFSHFRMTNELNFTGTLKGTDQFGNEYYEDLQAISGRHRFIVYADQRSGMWDPSTVPAEWHGWLHHTVDETPVELPPKAPKFQAPHLINEGSKYGSEPLYSPPGFLLNDKQLPEPTYSSWTPSK